MSETDFWQIYDALINGIPEKLVVDELFCGVSKAWVRCGEGFGFSLVLAGETRPVTTICKKPGMKLRDLAACVKSWNYVEASIGQAAINAYYNASGVAARNGIHLSEGRFAEDRVNDPFIVYQNAIRHKKVTIIERFHYLDQLFRPVCQLSVLALQPVDGEYSYAAAEYLLPESDYVFISGSALIDKSLPRFLKLAQQAYVVIVGPTTPLAPQLSQFGVRDLSGFVIQDGEKARRICAGQENYRIYTTGQKVSLKFVA
jgi:uncharacterized protein